MKNCNIILASLLIAVIGVSCKKDNNSGSTNNNTTPKTNTQLLTANTWQNKELYFGMAGTSLDNITFITDGCWFDNTIVFKSDGSFTADEGSNRCSNEPQTYTGTWKFNSNETTLTTTSTHDTTTFTIKKLDASNLELSTFVTTNSIKYETKNVFIKK